MGGRGAASPSGRYGKKNEKIYGSEYHTVLEIGNIKFIKRNSGASSAPLETQINPERKPNGRIYVNVSNDDKIRYISFYDQNGKKEKQWDVNDHEHRRGNINYGRNHVHYGYEHNEKGDGVLTPEERRKAAEIFSLWRKFQRSSKG